MQKYAILINTCDKFEDCWNPFFKLWSIYWPDCKTKIYLNTEYKDYSYPGLNITAIKGCEANNFPKNKRATWSQCLIWALEAIDTDIILYMQEDYFLKDHVKNEIIEKYVQLMKDQHCIHCIHLTDQAVIEEEKSELYNNLYSVLLNQRCRLSCQAALWKKNVLLEHIRPYESAWEFEEFGSKRSAKLNHNFYVVDRNWVRLNKFEIIPYIFTGIVQGRWYEDVVPLFEKHNIEVNFSKRGFLKNAKKKTLKQKLKYRINRIQILCTHFIETNKIRDKNI